MVTLLAWTVKRCSMPGEEDLDYWGCEQDHSDVSLMNDHFCDFLCRKFQDEALTMVKQMTMVKREFMEWLVGRTSTTTPGAYRPAEPGTSERHLQAAQGQHVNQLGCGPREVEARRLMIRVGDLLTKISPSA